MKKHKSFGGLMLRVRLLGLAVLLIIPSLLMTGYLLYSLNRISDSYSTIVQNITQINEYNLVFKEDMDSVMYMMVAHSLSKYEVRNELDMENPDNLIRSVETALEKVRATTVSPDALESVKRATRLLITLHKRVNDISSTVKETGTYDENMERLDVDIRVITEMIQDRISEYIYYESVSMEGIRRDLSDRPVRFWLCTWGTPLCLFRRIPYDRLLFPDADLSGLGSVFRRGRKNHTKHFRHAACSGPAAYL